MSTAVYTSIPPPGLSLAQRRHNRDSNSAGAPLPKLPRRASASSASRTAAGSRVSASASAVSEKTSKSDFAHPVSETPTHVASASSTASAPAAVVVQPPTPPQPGCADKEGEGMTNRDGCASDSSTSSDGSQIIVASPRGNRTRGGQRAPSPSPCVSISDNAPASSAPFKFPNLAAGSATTPAMRPADASAQPGRPRHQHSFSLDPSSVANPHGGRSISETPLGIRANSKTCRPLKSSLKMRSQSQCADISVFIPNTTSKSAPATPKAVHFDSQLERVKLFISKQKPSAVSRDGSPTDDTSGTDGDWPSFIFGGATAKESEADRARKNVTMTVSHFPDSTLRRHEDIVLERLSLASDASAINGQVRVRNLAFDKVVIARFTFDDWQTTSEVSMRYVDSFDHGAFDRFAFTIRLNDLLSRIEEKTFYLALKYIVGGREIWDNNGGRNYQAKFARKPLPAPARSQSQAPQRLARSIRRRAAAKPLSDEDVADLTGKLEEVARLSGSESPITTAEGDHSPTPFDRANADERFSFKSDPLATRYDFAASARQPWRPAEHQRVPRTSPGQMRSDGAQQTGHNAIRKSIADAFSSRPSTLPSPRTANEDAELGLVSPRKYAGYDDEDDGSCRPNRARRNHQRGYFDLQPQSFSLGPQFNLRRTQPGSPVAANSTLAALARYNSFPQTAAEESRSASASPAGTPGNPSLASTPAPAEDAGPGLASGGDVVAPVPGKAMSMLRPAWDSLLVFPGGSEDSTPSITSGESSRSNSPTPSPSEADAFARPAPERVTSPANESYSAFLNRFCFFTGPGAAHTLSETQRSHSASNVEEYFSIPASRTSYSRNGALTPRDMPSRPSSADSVRTAGSAATLN